MPRPVVGFEREQEMAMTLWKGADELGRLINAVQSMADETWNATMGKSNEDAADAVVIQGVEVMRALKTLALALDRTIASRADTIFVPETTTIITVFKHKDQWIVGRDLVDIRDISQSYGCEVLLKTQSKDGAVLYANNVGKAEGRRAFWFDEHNVSREITSTKG